MSYELLARVSQLASLVLFIAMFLAVVAYAFWPSNRRRFDEFQAQALDLKDRSRPRGRKT
jgi:cytochrome c oxidase cbb3-type subunit 4